MRLACFFRNNLGPLLAMTLGMAAFFVVVGPRALDPGNIAWLGKADPSQHYLGWLFYRGSGWSFPLGLNPDYGLELSSAIVFSDSIPLLAVFFKIFSDALPDVFQYFGIWLLACFMLQGYFGFKLVRLASNNTAINLLGTVPFLFSPPMLFRLHGHNSLVAHFILTASLYLVLRPSDRYRIASWSVLLCAASLIHPYFLAMAGALWIIDIAERRRMQQRPSGNVLAEVAGIVGLVALVVWQAGYFSAGAGPDDGGFGYYRMHPLSIIDPSGWSYTLSDIPEASGVYEGFNYLGSGMLLLAVLALIPLIESRTGIVAKIRGMPFLLLGLLAFAAFSLSNTVGVQSIWFELPLPDIVMGLANTFRSSGRFFWPVFYAINLTILYLIVKGYRKNVAIALLSLGMFVQVLDTSAGWRVFRDNTMQSRSASWATGMESSFWDKAAIKYQKTRSLPVVAKGKNWKAIAYYSGVHGLATSAVYLARPDTGGLARVRKETDEVMRSGDYESDSLYFVKKALVPLVARNLDQSRDLFASIDGYYVVAPGWKNCKNCPSIGSEVDHEKHYPAPISLGERIEFGTDQSGNRYLVRGWSHPEHWGVWSDHDRANLIFPLKETGSVERIVFEGQPLLGPALNAQRISIHVNGLEGGEVSLSQPGGEAFTIRLTGDMQKRIEEEGAIHVRFVLHDAVSPSRLGLNKDKRKLALGLKSVTVN